MANYKRLPEETYAQYRAKLKVMAALDKIQKTGTLFWNSTVNGTYVRGMK